MQMLRHRLRHRPGVPRREEDAINSSLTRSIEPILRYAWAEWVVLSMTVQEKDIQQKNADVYLAVWSV